MAQDEELRAIVASIADLKASVTAWRAESAHDHEDTRALVSAAHEATRAEMNKVRGDLMARIDRLPNKLSEVTDDITVNYASSDQSGRIAKAAQEEVRGLSEVVFAMQRQIRRIAAQVFGPDQAA